MEPARAEQLQRIAALLQQLAENEKFPAYAELRERFGAPPPDNAGRMQLAGDALRMLQDAPPRDAQLGLQLMQALDTFMQG